MGHPHVQTTVFARELIADRVLAGHRLGEIAEHAGPIRLAALRGLPSSTIGAVIARAGLPRLRFDPGHPPHIFPRQLLCSRISASS